MAKKIGNQQLTQGWYITGGIVVAIAFGNTKAAPVLLGILTVALIYQLTNLIEGVPPSKDSTVTDPNASGGGGGAKAESAPATPGTTATFV